MDSRVEKKEVSVNVPIRGGYILQPRCFDRSDSVKFPPVTRELWLYLLRSVNHSDNKQYKRGQGFFNLGDIQKDLSWFVGYRREMYSKPQLTKSLRRLCDANMVETMKATRGLIITVCNYSFYQDPKNYEGNNDGSMKEVPREREGHTKNKNVKNVKNDELKDLPIDDEGKDNKPSSAEQFYETKKGRKMSGKKLEDFNLFWKEYGYGLGKAAAGDSFLDVYSPGIFQKMIEGARREKGKRPAILKKGRTPKYAQGWLSERRWEDETEENLDGEWDGDTEERDARVIAMLEADERTGNSFQHKN